jgi:hypothetical protein
MTGTMPPTVLAKRVVKVITRPRRKKVSLGMLVGRALVRGGHATTLSAVLETIELKRGDKLEDWRDPKKVYGSLTSGGSSGLAGNLIKNATMGKNLATDLYDVLKGRSSASPSTNVGAFKVTENSPNTIRVTAGPERRERRKKYEWEKAETQRKIHKAVLTGAITGTLAVSAALAHKGGGSIVKGAKMYGQEIPEQAKRAAKGVADVLRGRSPNFRARTTPSATQIKSNTIVAKAKAAAETAAESDSKIIGRIEPDDFKKKNPKA